MKPEVVYIDGDILPYKVGFSTQHCFFLLDVEGLHTCSPFMVLDDRKEAKRITAETPDVYMTEIVIVESEFEAIHTLKRNIQNIVQGSGCNLFKVVVSPDSGNFREEVATIQPYKGNRRNFEKPKHWKMLREWLLNKSYTIIAEGEEADDVISRAMMEGHLGATIDKDLDNTPGWHYNFNKGEKYYVDEETAIRNFYTQTLTGDRADNIPGVPGVGPVKAKKALADISDPRDMEQRVLEYYEKAYPNDPVGALIEIGQLLWMRREPGEVWLPYADY